MQTEFNEKQFQSGFHTPLARKILEGRQANDYTKVDTRQEGICYACFRKDWVSGTLIDVCFPCAAKKGMEPILAIVHKKPYGFCYIHGGYSVLEYKNNIAQINVRVCQKCQRRIGKAHRELRRAGTDKVDPFWLSMRRKLGKDFKMLGRGLGGSTRR